MASKPSAEHVQDVNTVNEWGDIEAQILTNAEVLFPNEHDLKVVTGQTQTKLMYSTTIVGSNPQSASVHKEYKLVLDGPGGKDRRSSMIALLDETERRITKQVLKR